MHALYVRTIPTAGSPRSAAFNPIFAVDSADSSES
jgi:hypothetical protein